MLLAALVSALFAGASASEVKVLTEENFAATLDENTNVLVEFYAPWCGHCKKLAPEYDAAALKLKDEDVVLGKVDATEESKLASQFDVRGYPTLKWFKNGKVKDYDGGRSADTITSWVMKKIGPVLTKLNNAEEIEAFKGKGDVVVIAQLDEGSDDLAGYKAVAEDLDQPFGYITDAAVAQAANVEKVTLFKAFDEGRAVFDGLMSGLSDFVATESIPVVMSWQKNQDVWGKVTKKVPLVFAVFDGKDADGFTADLKEIALQNKGKYLFYTVDGSNNANSRLLEYFGISTGQTVVFDEVGRKKYKSESGNDGLADLLADIEAGSAKPTYKSEAVPEKNDGPVYVLVGTEFEKVALDPSKDVLVEFYAPWCGHCKQLAPKYKKLGKKYADDDNIIIAKMDATANEVSEPQVQGFPTIYFFPADDNTKGVSYDGDRDVDGFVKFIEKNRKSSPSGANKEEL